MKTVYFMSNVIADKGGDDGSPTSQFFDRIKVQHNVTKNGQESLCYKTSKEAESSLLKWKAEVKSKSTIFHSVHMTSTIGDEG